jgi:hypothetical protein
MFKDESLLEHHKMMQNWKIKNLKERILKYGGLYPGTFVDEFGKPHFDKENRVSLLIYSQYANLKNKFKSKNMKKIMKSKEVIREETLKPAKHFNEKSIEELKMEKLSPETDNLGIVAVSNKFRSPVKKFLTELDELVAYTQNEAPRNKQTSGTLSPPRSR